MNLVIAEDDNFCLRFIKDALGPMCKEMHDVDSLCDLIPLLNPTVDFVWLDLVLKDSTSEETISAIPEMKRRSPNASIMVVTGWGETYKGPALKAGADYYADKKDLKAFKQDVLAKLVQKTATEYMSKGGDAKNVLQAVSNFMINKEQK